MTFGRTRGWPSAGWASGRVGGLPGDGAAAAVRRRCVHAFGARMTIVQPCARGTARLTPPSDRLLCIVGITIRWVKVYNFYTAVLSAAYCTPVNSVPRCA